MYRLVYLTGPRQGRRVTVQEGDVLLGTATDCPIRLVHPTVAPQHAVLQFRPGGVYLRQLATGTALTINGQPVTEQQLVHGDEIGLANERLLFQLADSPSTPPRRVGWTHRLAQLAIGGVLLAQLLVIVGLLVYHRWDPIIVRERDPERVEELLGERLQRHAEVHDDRFDPTGPWEPFQLIPPSFVVPQYTFPNGKGSENMLPVDGNGAYFGEYNYGFE